MLKHLMASLAVIALLTGQALAQGTLEQVRVFSPSLEDNLAGEDAERDVHVYLPAGYEESDQRYPVIYFLHGYSVGAQAYVEGVLNLPEAADEVMAGEAGQAILVMPDAFTRYGGSMYSNSPTIGDWESWIARDLVDYIDNNYRTIDRREGRGLAGHSMGGYGTLRIGMKYPAVFNALYAMSSCCLLNQPPEKDAVEEQLARMEEGLEVQTGTFANVMQAQAAAWAPNPRNPPYYFDLPWQDGNPLPLVQDKWKANSLLITVDQHVPALRSFEAIMLDVGDEDGLEATNTRMDDALTRLEVDHGYEIYPGNHGNRVGQRFVENVLPFFEQHLEGQ